MPKSTHHKSKEREKTRSSGTSEPTAWSTWIKHPNNGRLYCWRTGSSGLTEYYYQDQDQDAPRTIPEEQSVNDMTSTFASTNLNSTNTYPTPPSTSTAIGTTSINSTPSTVNYGTSYPTTSSGYGQQGRFGANTSYATNATGPSNSYYQSNTSGNSMTVSSVPYFSSNTTTSGPSTSFFSANTSNLQTSNAYREGGSGDLTPREPIVPIHISKNPKNRYENRAQKDFKIHNSKDFRAGVVFQVLWTEPKGENSYSYNTVTTHHHETPDKGEIFTKMRRFIVTGSTVGHSQCVPILTYQGQATKKAGVKVHEHAVVYVRGTTPYTFPDEPTLPNQAIEISVETPRDKLEPASRIHYAKTYTVEHNLKVHIIGKVSHDFRKTFSADAKRILEQAMNRSFD